jgi:hypothetical protein
MNTTTKIKTRQRYQANTLNCTGILMGVKLSHFEAMPAISFTIGASATLCYGPCSLTRFACSPIIFIFDNEDTFATGTFCLLVAALIDSVFVMRSFITVRTLCDRLRPKNRFHLFLTLSTKID